MALATRCPNCQVLFRVVADQLKLRGGLVRCGACRHVFDAIGSLTYIEDSAAAAPEPAAARKAAPPTLHATAVATPMLRTPLDEGKARQPQVAESEANKPDWSGPPTLLAPPEEQRHAPPVEAPKEPVKRANREGRREARGDAKGEAKAEARREPKAEARVEAKVEPQGSRSEAEPMAHDIAAVAGTPARKRRRREVVEEPRGPVAPPTRPHIEGEAEEPHDEPEFLRASRAEAKRGFSVVYGGGSLLLGALLVLQLAVIFRTEITTRWPEWRPALVEICGLFGCNVGWPTRAELLAVVGTELQAIPGTDVLELTAVIRNRANFKVALPAIEVTLTDTTNRTVARKVFAPVDYLVSAGEPSSRIDDGLGPSSDLTVRVAFEARGINAVGFVVYPFYL
ncbi:MAG TPA: DUF3426 domain-containing protein [Burkholderiaceae bacterium]|nr:DUF3426 domain-containing protein [Burkholderiaceae bacterium]